MLGSKCHFKFQPNLKLSLSTVHFLVAFLTQHLGLSIFYPNLAKKNRPTTLIGYFLSLFAPNTGPVMKFQSCLTTEYAGVCFRGAKRIFLETLPNNMR